MSTIAPTPDTVAAALREAAWKRSAAPSQDAGANPSLSARAERTQDTVTLSKDGQKAVNFNQGAILAADIRKALVDGAFAGKLMDAMKAIGRIGRLFGETVRALFNWWR